VEDKTIDGTMGRVLPMMGYRIKAARRAAKLSRAQLARRLGVGTRLVADWERGDLRPEPSEIEGLAKVLYPDFGKARVWYGTSRPSPEPVETSRTLSVVSAAPTPHEMLKSLRAYSESRTSW
jgi:transcriptional regulator with XRE-family HTH domain